MRYIKLFESYDLDIAYRGVSNEELKLIEKSGHLIYYSFDVITKDPEVMTNIIPNWYNLSDEEWDIWLDKNIPFENKFKGVNLTRDVETAMGYSENVVKINLTGEYFEYNNYIFAENPHECIFISIV